MSIRKYGRYRAVYAEDGALICVTVYRKGAAEVVRRLQALDDVQRWVDMDSPREELEGPTGACPLF